MRRVADVIDEKARSLGMSQNAVAHRVGISEHTFRVIRRGAAASYSPNTIRLIALGFGWPEDWPALAASGASSADLDVAGVSEVRAAELLVDHERRIRRLESLLEQVLRRLEDT